MFDLMNNNIKPWSFDGRGEIYSYTKLRCRAVSDRGSRVRAMLAQQAEAFDFRHLLPRLDAMIASESQAIPT
jgi:hypothetical protein